MSGVCAPRNLAGLMCAHAELKSQHLSQTPFNRGEAFP